MGELSFTMAQTWIMSFAPKLVSTAVIVLIGIVGIRVALSLSQKFLKTTKIDPILHAFVLSVTKILLYVLLAITAMETMGLPTASLITSLGAAGLAVSLAVKDSIGNLAGGVVILLIKPFKLGDYIEMDSIKGTVVEIALVHTILFTPDNKRIYVPNDSVMRAKIINYSSEPNRRLDSVFSIGYHCDFDKAREIIAHVVQNAPLALKDPAPVIRMSEHSASSIDIVCRVWVKNADYYELNFYLKEHVKRAFDENGISIPFNQLDVHIVNN